MSVLRLIPAKNNMLLEQPAYTGRQRPAVRQSALTRLNSACNLAGTQTPGTNVDMARRTIDNRLDSLDIGLPRAVGPPVGMGNLNAKGHTLVTELTFSHPLHLLAVLNSNAFNCTDAYHNRL